MLNPAKTTISASFAACSSDPSRLSWRLQSLALATPVACSGDSSRLRWRPQPLVRATPVACAGDPSRKANRPQSSNVSNLHTPNGVQAARPNRIFGALRFSPPPAGHQMKHAHIRIGKDALQRDTPGCLVSPRDGFSRRTIDGLEGIMILYPRIYAHAATKVERGRNEFQMPALRYGI